MQDFCPSFVRSIFFLFQMKIWYLNYLFCCFLQISYYGKIQISRLERSLLLLPTFWMGNLLLFWHGLSQTPGTPILTIVLPALMYYVGFSWWSSFDKEYCQLSVFHLKKKKELFLRAQIVLMFENTLFPILLLTTLGRRRITLFCSISCSCVVFQLSLLLCGDCSYETNVSD